jgi:hypothetical protein
MTIYFVRDVHSDGQLGDAVKIETVDLKSAKKQAMRASKHMGDVLNIESEDGTLLSTKNNGLWRDAGLFHEKKIRQPPTVSSTPMIVFIVRELEESQLLQEVKINAFNLRGAMNRASRLASSLATELQIESETGTLLARKVGGWWQYPLN